MALQGAEAESFSQHQCVGTVGRQWMQSAGRESAAVSTNKNTLLTWETTVLIWWPGAESNRGGGCQSYLIKPHAILGPEFPAG